MAEEELYERLSTGVLACHDIDDFDEDHDDDSNDINDDDLNIMTISMKMILQFSALVEKVEVDLLNKDDDNYKREVLHSVQVFFLTQLLTQLMQLISAASDHQQCIAITLIFITHVKAYPRPQTYNFSRTGLTFVIISSQDKIHLLSFNFTNICDYYHRLPKTTFYHNCDHIHHYRQEHWHNLNSIIKFSV